MPLLWMQTSAEYRELCYQAFNLADMIVDKAVGIREAGRQAPRRRLGPRRDPHRQQRLRRRAHRAGRGVFRQDLGRVGERRAGPRGPGAVDFAKYAASKGVELFYVTNRDQAGFDGTLKNLAALGFPFADAKHLLVSAGSSDKQPRFDQVAKDYEIVAFLGDNENDLPLRAYHKSMKDRNAIVDQNKALFGLQFVVLPNPDYGDWESLC